MATMNLQALCSHISNMPQSPRIFWAYACLCTNRDFISRHTSRTSPSQLDSICANYSVSDLLHVTEGGRGPVTSRPAHQGFRSAYPLTAILLLLFLGVVCMVKAYRGRQRALRSTSSSRLFGHARTPSSVSVPIPADVDAPPSYDTVVCPDPPSYDNIMKPDRVNSEPGEGSGACAAANKPQLTTVSSTGRAVDKEIIGDNVITATGTGLTVDSATTVEGNQVPILSGHLSDATNTCTNTNSSSHNRTSTTHSFNDSISSSHITGTTNRSLHIPEGTVSSSHLPLDAANISHIEDTPSSPHSLEETASSSHFSASTASSSRVPESTASSSRIPESTANSFHSLEETSSLSHLSERTASSSHLPEETEGSSK